MIFLHLGAVGSLVVRASDSRPEGLGSMLDVTKYPPSAHGFTCRNCGGGDRGRVAIYRPFGEVSLSLNRTVTCMVLKANDRRTSCPCHDEFRGPRSDYVRQRLSSGIVTLAAVPLDLGSNPRNGMDVSKCIVPLRHGAWRHSRRANSRSLPNDQRDANRTIKLNLLRTPLTYLLAAGWKYTRIYNPQRRLRVLVIKYRTYPSHARIYKVDSVKSIPRTHGWWTKNYRSGELQRTISLDSVWYETAQACCAQPIISSNYPQLNDGASRTVSKRTVQCLLHRMGVSGTVILLEYHCSMLAIGLQVLPGQESPETGLETSRME
ncbi:uncharacterized protein TNCV_1248851 [Trichonephila clavipes]|nr:uncharacterized protein TNCV_1248851 [Trichonephila clavipes]